MVTRSPVAIFGRGPPAAPAAADPTNTPAPPPSLAVPMNFGMASPASSQPRNAQAGAIAKLPTAPENISAVVHLNGIVVAVLPFGTPRAAAIRAFFAARMLNDQNQRLFVFRKETNNSWTTIALESTPANPQLTAPPHYVALKLETTAASCIRCVDVRVMALSLTPLGPAAAKMAGVGGARAARISA